MNVKEKEKYYAPSIEEFQVGFEYEAKCPITKEWTEFKVDLSFGSLWLAYANDTRVKYLNREDIESLGWECVKEDYFYKRTSQTSSIDILFNEQESMIEIQSTEVMDEEPVRTLFLGTIKNKSELKKLLKQLGI
jgi:hypothetical protein